MTWAQVKGWFTRLVEDPDGSPSSTRVAALLTTVTGCLVAIAGMVLNREQAATVVALLGGGAATFFARKKSSDATPPEAP
jgi:hypothetical protein